MLDSIGAYLYAVKRMDQTTIVERLRKRCARSSQTAVAAELGVSKQYLCDVLAGRREPGPAVLNGLGLVRKVTYQPTNGS